MGRGGRACLPCASAKRKCSGGEPCVGCHKRSQLCSYAQVPTSQKTNRSDEMSNRGSISSSHEHSDSFSDADTHYGNGITTPGASPNPESSSPVASDSSQRNFTGIEHAHSNESFEENSLGRFPSEIGYGFDASSPQQTGFRSNNRYSTVRSPPAFSMSTGVSSNAFNPSATWSTSQVVDGSSSMTNHDSRLWPESNIPSINWLPEDWLPDFQHDIQDDALPVEDSITAPPQANSQSISRTFTAYDFATPVFDNTSSPDSQGSQLTGRFYVDGQGGRLPHVGSPLDCSPFSYEYQISCENSSAESE